MDWQSIASAFEADGSLRDIYVLETSMAEWQKVCQALRKLQPPPLFSIDGTEQPLPQDIADIFAGRSEHSPLLSVNVGELLINSHFFQDDEIEFDIDPKEVVSLRQVEDIAAFMQMLGDAADRTVILTTENTKEAVIARYSPKVGKVIWTALEANHKKSDN
jgi:hypothetical protein